MYGEDAYTDLIDPELPDFVSGTFEQLCQHAVLYAFGDEYRFVEEPGNWWDGSGSEIDIVAPTNGERLLVGEVKFRQDVIGYDVLSQLESEAPKVDWHPESSGDPEYTYALFSRSGFSSAVKEAESERDDLHLFTVNDVVGLITE